MPTCGSSTNCYHKVWSIQLSRMPLYAVVLLELTGPTLFQHDNAPVLTEYHYGENAPLPNFTVLLWLNGQMPSATFQNLVENLPRNVEFIKTTYLGLNL